MVVKIVTLQNLNTIREILNTDDIHLTIVKKRQSKDPKKRRDLLKVGINNQVLNFFRETLERRIDSLEINELVNYYDLTEDYFDPCIIENPFQIPTMDWILNQSQNFNGLNDLDDPTENQLKQYPGYAIHFNVVHLGQITYFSKFNIGAKLKPTFLNLVLRHREFDRVQGNIFEFNKSVSFFFVHLKNNNENENENDNPEFTDFIISFNTKHMESILDFRQLHNSNAREAREILNNWDSLEINEDMFNSIFANKKVRKKLSKMKQANKFQNLSFQRLAYLKDEIPQLAYEVDNEKIKIDSKEAFDHFLRVINFEYLIDYINTDKFFLAKNSIGIN